VLLSEDSLADDLIGHLSAKVHDEFQHLVVGLAREEYPGCVHLKDSGRRGPEVEAVVVTPPDDWTTNTSNIEGGEGTLITGKRSCTIQVSLNC